jgi:hypothetical protein
MTTKAQVAENWVGDLWPGILFILWIFWQVIIVPYNILQEWKNGERSPELRGYVSVYTSMIATVILSLFLSTSTAEKIIIISIISVVWVIEGIYYWIGPPMRYFTNGRTHHNLWLERQDKEDDDDPMTIALALILLPVLIYIGILSIFWPVTMIIDKAHGKPVKDFVPGMVICLLCLLTVPYGMFFWRNGGQICASVLFLYVAVAWIYTGWQYD